MFFSENAKRIDYEINASCHLEENAEYLVKNNESGFYKSDRISFNSMQDFRDKSSYQKDIILKNYQGN